jgi:hypothetical protein
MAKRIQYNSWEEFMLRRCFLVARGQARHRGETWNIDWEVYRDMWLENDNYKQKGQGSDNFAFSRINCFGDWEPTNVVIERRGLSIRRHNFSHAKKRRESE